MKTIRLTAAQALVRYLANQLNEDGVPTSPASGPFWSRQCRRYR